MIKFVHKNGVSIAIDSIVKFYKYKQHVGNNVFHHAIIFDLNIDHAGTTTTKRFDFDQDTFSKGLTFSFEQDEVARDKAYQKLVDSLCTSF